MHTIQKAKGKMQKEKPRKNAFLPLMNADGRRFFFLSASTGETTGVRCRNFLTARNFLTPGVDIEGIFCRLAHLKALNPNHANELDEIHAQALAECAAEFKNKAKKGSEEIDNLRHKSGLPTKGEEVNVVWVDGLNFTDERWIQGKTFLSKLRGLFQQKIGTDLIVETPSNFLKLPTLEAVLPAPLRRKNRQLQPFMSPQLLQIRQLQLRLLRMPRCNSSHQSRNPPIQ